MLNVSALQAYLRWRCAEPIGLTIWYGQPHYQEFSIHLNIHMQGATDQKKKLYGLCEWLTH